MDEGCLCTRGAIKEYLLADKQVSVKPYAQGQKAKEAFFSHEGGWVRGSTVLVRAATENHHYEAEKSLPPERSRVNVPMLFIGCTKDPVCLIEMIRIP
jgi:soluble epoxide hydrolase / lipid-phosphate phosphatase